MCEALSKFVSNTSLEKIPTEVIRIVKWSILDTLGVTVLGTRATAAKILSELVKSLGLAHESTVVGQGYKTAHLYASYVNSAASAYLELDDGHRRGGVHPGCIVIPAALAVGECNGASGEDILCAVVVGYEVTIRIGMATGLAQFKRGIDAPATCGIFGAAAAAGFLMGLNEQQITHALAIAGSLSPLSPSIWYYEPSMVKSLPMAEASQGGILSALLAERGLIGPLCMIEGVGGFAQATCTPEKYQLDAVVDELGKIWKMRQVYFKFYPSCRWTHSAIDAALEIRGKYGIQHQDVEEVVVKTYPTAAQLTTVEPQDDTVARLSIPYVIAVAIIHGNVYLDHFDPVTLRSPDVLEIAHKVKVINEPSFRDLYPERRPTTVIIRLKDGSEFSSYVEHPLGEPENPPTYEQIREKFMKGAGKIIGVKKAIKILEMVEILERLDNVEVLMTLLS